MSMTDLVDRFFAIEGNDHVIGVLQNALDEEGGADGCAYFTFNVFNVWVDRGRRVVRVQDDLEPGDDCELPLDDFSRRLALASEALDRAANQDSDP